MNKLLKFPNVSISASYSPVSQTINFNYISKRQFDDVVEQLKSRRFNLATINTASTIVHEAAHYFDHMATLSGQVLLAKVYNSLNELKSGSEETDEIVSLLNTLQSWCHHHYTESRISGIHDSDPKNWSYSYNTGFGKDVLDKPVFEMFLFAIFKYQGNYVGNVPFSIESLWETNAMWAEITYHINLAQELLDKDTKIIEFNQISRKYKDYLYNSDLLVYSLAAHFTSSFCGLGDILRSFKLSKALSSISLNLPFCYYDQIKRTQGTAFREYTNVLLQYSNILNPCAVYLALLENLIESGVDVFADGLDVNIDDILASSGLPSKDVLQNNILAEMHGLNIKDMKAEFSEVYAIQKANGINLFRTYGIEGGLNVHPACFIDVVNKSNNTLFQQIDDEELETLLYEETDAVKRHYEFERLEKQMRQTIEALRNQ